MKSLQNYVYEESLVIDEITIDEALVTEGFWKKLCEKFGFGIKKLGQAMKSWKSELRDGFTLGQYLAAKSNDGEIKKTIKAQSTAAEKGTKELLKEVKASVERLMKNLDGISIPDYLLQQRDLLKELLQTEKDEEGNALLEKFSKLIDKKFPDGGKELKEYAAELDKVKKSKQADKIVKAAEESENKEKGEEGESKEEKEADKQAAVEATEAIKDNVELFKQLAKTADINGEGLRDYVSKYILTRNADGKLKTKEEIEKISDDEVLATCIIVCGAVMTKNNDTFARIVKAIYNGKDGKNGLENAMKMVKK